MGRKAGDGRGRLGGRAPGVGNKKDEPTKELMRKVTQAYMTPRKQDDGRVISDLEADLELLLPSERLHAQLKIAEFHTPKPKAIDVTLEASVKPKTIEDLLAELCKLEG